MDYPYGAIAGDGKLSASFAWLHNFRRINTHYDYYAQNYLAFVHHGCLLILLLGYF